jgi:hypothetical protein
MGAKEAAMPARKVSYCYVMVPNRPGQGAQVLGELKKAKVNLLAYSGFPTRGGKAQLDLVTDNLGAVRKIAKDHGWRLSDPKKGFLIQGRDRVGAVHQQIQRLADEKINITAADAVCAGRGRYGMLLWVKTKDYGRAARYLKAK